jgi:hypothetical protein
MARGVTDTRTADVTLHVFRRACHQAAHRVAEVTFYDLTEAVPESARVAPLPDYHVATLRDRRGRHRVLCHPRGGYVAFAAPPPYPGACDLSFTEPPRWAEVFAWHGLTVLTPATLATPLALVDLRALAGVDPAGARDATAGTLGALLFTWRSRPREHRAGPAVPRAW